MASASDHLENQILNFYLNGTSVSPPTIWLSLHTADPLDAGSGTEVSGSAYGRENISAKFPTASGTGGSVTNDVAITGFTADGGDWGTITHIGIWDAETSGNLLFHSALDSSVAITDGDSFQITATNLTVTIA